MSNCVDQTMIELIARNAILRMIADHTLQAGLRSCSADCSWLGHETRVVTCAQLEDAIEDALGLQVLSMVFDPNTNLLTLTTNGGAHSVDLSALEGGRPVAFNADASGNLTLTLQDGTALSTSIAAYVAAATSALNGDRPVALNLDAAGVLTLTLQDGTSLTTSISAYVNAAVAAVMVFGTTTGPSTTESSELPTTVIGDRSQLLGRPDGWMTISGKRVPFWNAPECP